jgi:hypothetical protein
LTPQKNRSIGRSFRINEQWINVLYEEAEREGITPNFLVNRILQDYCLFHRFFKRYDGVSLTQKSFSSLLESCSREKLEETAKKAGSTIAQDLFRTFELKFNYDGVTYFLTTVLDGYANWYKCQHYVQDGTEIFHMRHNLGEKWSIYVAEVSSNAIEFCCNKKAKKEFLDGAVTIKVPTSQSL